MNRSATKKLAQVACLTVFLLASFAGPCGSIDLPLENWHHVVRNDALHISTAECDRLIFTFPYRTIGHFSSHRGDVHIVSDRGAANLEFRDLELGPQADEERYYHETPYLSPDGSRFVYTTDCYSTGIWPFAKRNFEIVTSNVDGTDARRLTNTRYDEFMPAWSPDGTRIAFYSDLQSEQEELRLYTVSIDGTDLKPIAHSTGTCRLAHDPPAWSPDGTRLTFRDGDWGEIYVVDSDGSNLMKVYSRGSERMALSTPSWSPDGGKISFATRGDVWNIYIIDLDNGHISSSEFVPPLNTASEPQFKRYTRVPSVDLFDYSLISWSSDGVCIKFQGICVKELDLANGDIRDVSDGG